MPDLNLLSLLVSVIAVVISTVALVRSRKLAEKQLALEQQQADLAKKQLERMKAEEYVAQFAQIDLQFAGYDSSRELLVQNVGLAEARNVNVRWIGEPPRFYDEDVKQKLPIGRLKPGKSIELRFGLNLSSPTRYEAVASWLNPDGSEATEEFELHV